MPTTSSPRSSNFRLRLEPINPAAPVTNIFKMLSQCPELLTTNRRVGLPSGSSLSLYSGYDTPAAAPVAVLAQVNALPDS